MNKVKLTVELTFSQDANVTERDKRCIIENVMTALRNQINSGSGLAPDEPEITDYITDAISVKSPDVKDGGTLRWNMGLNKKVVYNVTYFKKNGEVIDNTQIDEENEELAWGLFKEFGHIKKKGDYLEFEETTEEE